MARDGDGPRWGRGRYLLAWLVLVVPQLWAVSRLAAALWPAGGERDGATIAAWVVVVGMLQLAKWIPTTRRLHDLGRASDDVLYMLLPVMQMVLFLQLLAAAPTDQVRDRRIRSWATQMSAPGAYAQAARWLGPTAIVGVPLCVVGSAAWSGGGAVWLGWITGVAGSDAAPGFAQGAALIAGLLGLYTLVQLAKRDRVTRASWWPTLGLLPAVAVLASLSLGHLAAQGLGPVLVELHALAWDLSVGLALGGVAAALWIASAEQVRRGEAVSWETTVADARGHVGDTVVASGARLQLVQVGLQAFLIPGVWFAVSYALSEFVVYHHPDRSMFRGSSDLTRGIRGKIFKVLTLWFVMGAAWWWLIAMGLLGPEIAFASLFDPSLVSPGIQVIAAFGGWWLPSWWATLAMLAIFHERDALWLARQARQAREADAEA